MVACGTQKSAPADQSPAPAASAEAAAPVAAPVQSTDLPTAAIVRVPVDASGNATGEPELRAYKGTADLSQAEGVSTAFASVQAKALMVTTAPTQSELDKDSSTQSWGCWGSRASCGGWGRNYWSGYSPTLYWGGCGYNYGYSNYSYFGGYNYYYYQPSYGYGYGGYGYGGYGRRY